MELQQERIVKERKLRHDQMTALQLYITEELNKIPQLLLIGEGDRKFVLKAVLYLTGKGDLTEPYLDFGASYDWRDNARLYLVTAIVYIMAPADITPIRLKHMVAYLNAHRYLDDELDDTMERLTGMRAANVLALA